MLAELTTHQDRLGLPPRDASADDPRQRIGRAITYYTHHQSRMTNLIESTFATTSHFRSRRVEESFLRACDDWQFPLFLTLMLTGLRPGELAHLLLPADLDLMAGVLRVRNKVRLGWQVKTRNEREIPLVPIIGPGSVCCCREQVGWSRFSSSSIHHRRRSASA